MLSRRALDSTRIARILGAGLVSFVFAGPAGAQLSLFANDSEWVIDDTGGTSDGTLGGTCDGSPGFAVTNAFLGNQPDAYDLGNTIWVDGVQFIAGAEIVVESSSVTAGPVEMSGLDVFVQYRTMTATNTLRTLVGFVNPTSADIDTQVVHATNVASNAQTANGPFSNTEMPLPLTNNRWIITHQNFSPPIQPVITHVHQGIGGQPASAVAIATFACVLTQGIQVTYDITVPAGETRYLLFFNSLSESVGAAAGNAKIFDDPSVGGDLLFPLLPTQLLQVLNWDFKPDCRSARRQSLKLKSKKGTMEYRWTRGDATTTADFGDPLQFTSYLLCIIDFKQGFPFIETCAEAPAGTLGWREKGNGYKYRAKDGAPDGLTRLKLRRGEQRRGKITSLGKGMDFELPLEQDPEVDVLVLGNNICWQGRFVDEAKKSDAEVFKAKQRFSSDELSAGDPPPPEDPQ
jgi:hypothetical protein